jgi:hypothetical protein
MIRVLFMRDFAPKWGLVYTTVVTLDTFILFRDSTRFLGERRRQRCLAHGVFRGGRIGAAENRDRMLEGTCCP